MKKQLATILRHNEQAERQAAQTPGGSGVREQPKKSERLTSDDTGGPPTEGTANNDIDSGVFGLIDVPIRREAAGGLKCDPRMWGRFNCEKAAKTSSFRDLLVCNFVNLSVPAPHTHGDFVEHIAKAAHIPIDSLPVLNAGVFSRSQVAFGFAGDLFDKVAREFDDLQWWVSDVGLRMEVVAPPPPESPNP